MDEERLMAEFKIPLPFSFLCRRAEKSIFLSKKDFEY